MHKPISHISEVKSAVGGGVVSGPIRMNCSPVGLYLDDVWMERMAKLMRYAAERLDSGKVSPELRESEQFVRWALRQIEVAEAANRQADEVFAKFRPGVPGQ